MKREATVERIKAMEEALDEVLAANEALSAALAQFEAAQDKVSALEDYLDSGVWQRDFEADEAGLLPHDLKRGVLSEDALYNALADSRQNVRTLGELGAKLAR